jgi:hypothetical protein
VSLEDSKTAILSVTDQLLALTHEQLYQIADERDKVDTDSYVLIAQKARRASAQLHPGEWMLRNNVHINAALRACRREKVEDSLALMSIVSAIEIFSVALIGQEGLTQQEWNLVIAPVASILFPEMFSEAQHWETIELNETPKHIPYYPPDYAPKVKRRGRVPGYNDTARSELDTVVSALAGLLGNDKQQPEEKEVKEATPTIKGSEAMAAILKQRNSGSSNGLRQREDDSVPDEQKTAPKVEASILLARMKR